MGSAHIRSREMKRRQSQKNGSAPAEAAPREPHLLDMVDALLAQHRPFGDSDYIHEQLRVRYQARLGKISEPSPLAGELSRALDQAAPHLRYRTTGDPVVRYAIHEALRHAWNGSQDGMSVAECDEIFRATLGHLRTGRRGGPLEAGNVGVRRLGTEPHHGSIWTEEHRHDVFGRSFRKIIHDNFGGEPLCTPSATDLARLAKGAELLGALLPLSSRSVFSHTHWVVVVPHVGTWKKKVSCSEYRLSGTIFLNREMLHNPWCVAEHLLHESLHQKLYDFRHTHSLLAQDLSAEPLSLEGAAGVESIWNVGGAARSNAWDTFRAVAAFHVYVHLAVLSDQVDRRKTELAKRFGAPDASFPGMTHRRDAFQRAQYLGRRIKECCGRELGPAGRLFVDWLISILNAIDPAPPPPDSSYLHLLLNRYMVEATLVAKSGLPSDLVTRLPTLVDDEAETMRRVLVEMDAGGPDLDRLNVAVARLPDEGAEAAFLRFRSLVAGILQSLSPDGYGLRRSSSARSAAPAEKMIRAMVDSSSQQLSPAFGG